ncbi:MAG: hypothetical protein ACJ75B_03920 [Flavisolibacter sp.]
MKRSFGFVLSFLFLATLYSCQKELSFESHQPTAPASGGTAIFTLSGSGASCMNSNMSGTYAQGTAMGSSNSVTIEVNVGTIGTWTMNSNSVSGFYFAGSGTFSATGVQTITLLASGTPSAQGDQTFTLTAGGGTCTFIVTVAASGTTTPAGDHFPLTANSWWSYEDISTPGDTIKIVNAATKTIGANTYRLFQWTDDAGPFDTSFYRKSGNDYLEYTLADQYSALTFDVPQKADILFLKEGLTTSQTWNSAEYSGQYSGQNVKLRYAFTCANANATVTVNGQSFSNVYVINFKGQVSLLGSPYTDDGTAWTVYYGQNIGLIFEKVEAGTNSYGIQIRHWKVM